MSQGQGWKHKDSLEASFQTLSWEIKNTHVEAQGALVAQPLQVQELGAQTNARSSSKGGNGATPHVQSNVIKCVNAYMFIHLGKNVLTWFRSS